MLGRDKGTEVNDMRCYSAKWIGVLASLGVACPFVEGASMADVVSAVGSARAAVEKEASAEPPTRLSVNSKQDEDPMFKNWESSGTLDFYYQYNDNESYRGHSVNGRLFDSRNQELQHMAFLLHLNMVPTPKNPFGLNFTIWSGDAADKHFGFDSSNGKLAKHLLEAFITFPTGGGTIDLGKFKGFLGYEDTENFNNDNYSRGLLFTMAQPRHMTGIRGTIPLNDRIELTAFVVNGWNETDDPNGSKTFGGVLNVDWSERTKAKLALITGREGGTSTNNSGSYSGLGFGSAGSTQVDSAIFNLRHQVDDRTSLGFEAQGLRAKTPNKADAFGGGVYLKHQFNDQIALAFRGETVEVEVPGDKVTIDSLTGTIDYLWGAKNVVRFEARHDSSNKAMFLSKGPKEKTQTTFTVAFGFRF